MSRAEVNYHMWLRNRAKRRGQEELNECKRSLGEYKRRLDECEKREKVAKVATLVAASTGEDLPVEVEKNIKEFLGGRKKRSKKRKKGKGKKTRRRKKRKTKRRRKTKKRR